MKLRSLRARMLVMAVVAALVALGLAGWAMANILERFVTQGLDQRLDAQLAVMASAVRDDGSVDRARLEQRIGAMAAGPGWRWHMAGPRGVIGSADFPRLGPTLPGPPPPPDAAMRDSDLRSPVPLEGQDHQGRVHARRIIIGTSAGPVALSAAAPADVIARPIRAALVPLLSVILGLAVIFAVAALVQLRFGLRPVLALRDQVSQIRHGTRQAVDEDQPEELRPLALELNALTVESAAALHAARASAANLAHALKTPVATLALSVSDDPIAAAQVERIDRVIRHHLARARAIAIGRRARTSVSLIVADLVQTIGALHRGVEIGVDVSPDLAVGVDVHDLTEIIGNLLDNAARHARTKVTVCARSHDGQAFIAVDDDGPGIPPDQRKLAMVSGMRLDEGPTGYGFGLSIVRDLVTLYGGSASLAESPLGGLQATVQVPASQ